MLRVAQPSSIRIRYAGFPHIGLTTLNIRFLPHISCQSVSRQPQSRVYIPTISRYLEALIAQDQKENATRNACRRSERVIVLGDADPKREDIVVDEKRVKEPDGETLDQYEGTHKNRFTFRLMEE